ncbi:MAG TPA: exodeoxyribonuclease VII small subunit [Dehalococcoidia bacterium]|nr:exodeoxyribonuclease VII small subunit [Dehalococcoidia bacterium]HAI09488.1 exodeoxyribonuclease VII small subunit [Dehalococcoidia bacterium]HAJ01018.1 exodeoxyribonuclease VII small subunit [Dehalococcoidia bacterium]
METLSFEEAFQRLNEMAESLDDGGLSLADATARYEEGMNLVRRCNQLLDEAELKITNLKDSFALASDEEEWDPQV